MVVGKEEEKEEEEEEEKEEEAEDRREHQTLLGVKNVRKVLKQLEEVEDETKRLVMIWKMRYAPPGLERAVLQTPLHLNYLAEDVLKK